MHAGPLQGPHQAPAVVDLAILGKQQARPPARPDRGDLPLQAGAIQGFAEGCRGVGIPFGGADEGHHDPADPQAAGQAAIGFDPRHPVGDPRQARLTQSQQGALQALGMGRQHAGRHETCRLAASPAQHGGRPALAGQFMGEGQADQAAAQDQHRIRSRGSGACSGVGAARHGLGFSP